MLDFVVALVQFLCFIGLLYGAFLCLVHRDCVDTLRSKYDPITSHDWVEKPAFIIVEALRTTPQHLSAQQDEERTVA